MAPCCSICLQDDEAVVFSCSKRACEYHLCTPCVREAFKDGSGANSAVCQFCRSPSAMDMISAVCGPGAIEAVKDKVRSSIEFELKVEMVKRDVAKKDIAETNTRAREIFNEITDEINLRCPRCKMVFNDYDGCNALVCAYHTCKAAFCAICLQDCGSNAHPHVLTAHGDYFDKKSFYSSKANRSKSIVEDKLTELSHESFELKQLVRNHVEKAKLLSNEIDSHQTRTVQFLQNTRESLKVAIKNDRLGLLSNPDEYRPGRKDISERDISPRSGIQDDFRVRMWARGSDVYRLTLEHKIIEDEDRWTNISLKDVANQLKDVAHAEIVMNLIQNIRCAVVVFEGETSLYQTQSGKAPKGRELQKDEVCVYLKRINQSGELNKEPAQFGNCIRVIGINPNIRMIKLERHIAIASDSDLMFPPLKNLIGDGKPTPCLTEILRPVPNTLQSLNDQQQRVAHPLKLKTATEIAGPPGTGKTKTIIELVSAILECTDFDIFVLSERNGAINAIADKFEDVSLDTSSKKKIKIKDPRIWLSLLTYGAGDTMGESTKRFTLNEKLRYHPDIVKMEEKRGMLQAMSSALAESIRDGIANEVEKFGDLFQVDRAKSRARLIRKDKVDLNTPLSIIGYINATIEDVTEILPHLSGGKVTEEDTERVILERSAILSGLFEIRTDPEKERNPRSWNRTSATKHLVDICKRLRNVLQLEICDEEKAQGLFHEQNQAKVNYQALFNRLEVELPEEARVHMSTIGSSHRMPVHDRSSVVDDLSRMSIREYSDSEEEYEEDEKKSKKTIVVFDEAGCIPSYELLGLSRLGRDIQALVVVGDKHQLPPYDASQGRLSKHHGNRRNLVREVHQSIKSILDVSELSTDDNKVMLTTQYRVPKDIADILNTRIYNGSYNTCPSANVPHLGLNVVHIPEDPNPRRKYVNSNEIDRGLELVDELSLDHRISNILIITPYKNQQREFQYQMRKKGMSCTVLTIDQCQGQEADAVILSLVRKPTQFLNKNRLNVALSRVRKKLFVLVDKHSLRAACANPRWESAHLASDILHDA